MSAAQQEAIQKFWETGHFWSPDNPEGSGIQERDLPKLSFRDPVVIQAAISFSRMNKHVYTESVVRHHSRLPMFDGELGPAMQDTLATPRCAVPDYAPPPGVECHFEDPYVEEVVDRMRLRKAVGGGSWPRCHGVGEFHSATVKVNPSGMPSNLQPHFTTILKDVRNAYAEIGLLIHFLDRDGKDLLTGKDRSDLPINIDFSFVSSSDGWIGLAILGNRESCSSRIWCRFLSTWIARIQSVESLMLDVGSLIRHEIGHNTGLEHTSGGTMNPSLIPNLPKVWTPTDPSTPVLRRNYGGIAVPTGDPDAPIPNPPKVPNRDDQQDIDIAVLKAGFAVLAREMSEWRKKNS